MPRSTRTNPSLLSVGEVVSEMQALKTSVGQSVRRMLELSQVLERRASVIRRAAASNRETQGQEEAIVIACLEQLDRRAAVVPLPEYQEQQRRELRALVDQMEANRREADPASSENVSALLTYARTWGRLAASVLHGLGRSRYPERIMMAALERSSFDADPSMVPHDRVSPRIVATESFEGAPRSDDFDEVYGEVLSDAENTT